MKVFKYSTEKNTVVCECLDVSDVKITDEVCTYVDSGVKVQALAIDKTNADVKVGITFTGLMSEQIGSGVIISGYRAKSDSCVVDIERGA
jgi:hypothetical protein